MHVYILHSYVRIYKQTSLKLQKLYTNLQCYKLILIYGLSPASTGESSRGSSAGGVAGGVIGGLLVTIVIIILVIVIVMLLR